MNIISSWYLESANHCSGMFPPEENEIELAGLTCLPSTSVKPPRVAEAAVHFECEVIKPWIYTGFYLFYQYNIWVLDYFLIYSMNSVVMNNMYLLVIYNLCIFQPYRLSISNQDITILISIPYLS